VRSVESTALRLLRALEEEGQKQRASALTIKVPSDVAIYTLNQKRRELARIESDYGMIVMFEPSDEIHAGHFDIDRTAQKAPEERKVIAVSDMPAAPEVEDDPEIQEEYEAEEAASEDASERPAQSEQPRDGEHRRGGKRRRRRGGRDRERAPASQETVSAHPVELSDNPASDDEEAGENGETHHAANGQPQAEGPAGEGQPGEGGHRRRRRRRRGGRGRNRDGHGNSENAAPQGDGAAADGVAADGEEIATPNTESAPMWSLGNERHATPEPAPIAVKAPEPETIAEPLPVAPIEPPKPAGPPRKGWWQRTFTPD
jgi:ribonuclease E